jgi:hypothetical protein
MSKKTEKFYTYIVFNLIMGVMAIISGILAAIIAIIIDGYFFEFYIAFIWNYALLYSLGAIIIVVRFLHMRKPALIARSIIVSPVTWCIICVLWLFW